MTSMAISTTEHGSLTIVELDINRLNLKKQYLSVLQRFFDGSANFGHNILFISRLLLVTINSDGICLSSIYMICRIQWPINIAS